MKLTDSVTRLKWSSNRVPASLVRGGVATIDDLVRVHPWNIFDRNERRQKQNKVQGLGIRSLKEIERVLDEQGLRLSMTEADLEEWKNTRI